MFVKRLMDGGGDHAGAGHLDQQFEDGFAIQQLVIPLIAVVHQAVVAGSLAVLPRSGARLWSSQVTGS